ncbi:MAG: alginate lyase family protein, partial [Lentisphaerae bacterium]|nr:alginate lyase family protein [Lentisphaerota bacterium]
LYDHQVKTAAIPMGQVHNKAVFEQRGFINTAFHFNEFREAGDWLALGMERARENFLLQTTGDGVQREWSYGYHQGVLRDAVEIKSRMDEMGMAVPEDYVERIRRMHDYIFWVATPDLGAPMFGDGSRPLKEGEDRTVWPLYPVLSKATDLLGDPKYRARAELNREWLPDETSQAFEEAGMYVLRSEWGPDQIHLGLHCSPLGISSHDQPDNGTFELYAYGRWLMPDTGFYTYGHDRDARLWHRQTSVHQTMTLDGRDSAVAGRHLLWHSDSDHVALVVENGSYEGLVHRRTVWFVDRRFFVFFDEAIGHDVPGQLGLHFQFAPGDVVLDTKNLRADTQFEDANVLVAAEDGAHWRMVEEDGWSGWAYGHRARRKAFRFEHDRGAPASFVTAVVPYRRTVPPNVVVGLSGGGAEEARIEGTADVSGEQWRFGRDLDTGTAWCERVS